MASIVSGVVTILSTIIRQEYEFLGGLRGELQSIKDEFQQMMDFLQGADLLVQDHPELRSWVDQVRDVAYDVEDVLDEFVMRCTYHRATRWYGIFRKMYAKSVGAITRHKLANQVQEIKKRISDISESHGRYKTQYQSLLSEQGLSSRVSRVNNMQYAKRGDALLLEEADLVGIEVPKKILTDLLLNKDERRNVISIAGMGGLGKTTLVKNVYDSVKSKFVNHVWITVSQSFKLEELFKDTIRKLFTEESRQLPQELDNMDINELKSVVKELLQTKKYMVVLDDVWQSTHWDTIHLAFPRNKCGSRIVITTRNSDVGRVASTSEVGGYTYFLSPLNNEKSMLLFCRKAFPNGTSCPQHLEQICEKILGTCGGSPLAIEVIGSNLARRSRRTEEWELFYRRLSVEIEHNSQLDSMAKLISLSYHDLPLHLQNCFLYLSIFPEDTEINKELLARLWIGEGFLERMNGMTPEEVAESYLNELVDRCLVQVGKIGNNGDIEDVRVHDIIRHIIILKAREHNMTTIFDGQGGISFENNVRRLSVQGSITEDVSEQVQGCCKSIRTLCLFKYVGGDISEPFLSNLLSHGRKLLRVLDLTDAELERIPDEIFKLFHLKYLSLENTNVRFVPKSIGMLQSLEFLNLLGTGVTQLPVEILKLQHLRHLIMGHFEEQSFVQRFDEGVRASFRIGRLKSLQQLGLIEADEVDNTRVVTEIGKLIHLRKLGITKLKREDGKELCSSLGNLRELRELYVYSVNEEEFIDFHYCESSDLPQLHTLVLVGRLEKCPEFISSLNRLTTVNLLYTKLSDDPLKCLHDLPNLISLNLTAAYQGHSLCFKAGGFPKLRNLRLFLLEELRWVTVEENALPSLQLLWMYVCQSMEEIPTGFEYLRNLQKLEFSNMSNEFVNKLENMDKQSAAYKRLIQIPKVYNATGTHTGSEWSTIRRLKKDSWITVI